MSRGQLHFEDCAWPELTYPQLCLFNNDFDIDKLLYLQQDQNGFTIPILTFAHLKTLLFYNLSGTIIAGRQGRGIIFLFLILFIQGSFSNKLILWKQSPQHLESWNPGSRGRNWTITGIKRTRRFEEFYMKLYD